MDCIYGSTTVKCVEWDEHPMPAPGLVIAHVMDGSDQRLSRLSRSQGICLNLFVRACQCDENVARKFGEEMAVGGGTLIRYCWTQ
jgi:hypothetical protein